MGGGLTDTDDLVVEVLKAALVAVVSMLPVFLYLYLEEPRVRWAVDSWVSERTYGWRMREWQKRWDALPGWRQEVWQLTSPPPRPEGEPPPAWGSLVG